jgi:tRNA-splicing ligase RtcB
MKARELANLGVPTGEPLKLAVKACVRASEAGMDRDSIRAMIAGCAKNPAGYVDGAIFGQLARAIQGEVQALTHRLEPAPHKIWGKGLEAGALQQLRNACDLPVAAAAALMPDAHQGYGLPIGGVLATRNAVIPYAVGVDIACRMKMTVYDIPVAELEKPDRREKLINAIEQETIFGMGGAFKKPRTHEVLDADWSISPVTHRGYQKAASQLGTSGSGNHFVEWGILTLEHDVREPSGASEAGSGWNFDLPAGRYLALLSHSGSRGTGAAVCDHYSKIAMKRLEGHLAPELRHLAWLDMDSGDGQEYFAAMNLMGQYASANHACIHTHIAKNLGVRAIAGVENHHNFAWRETHDVGNGPEEFIVHRKGATPAGAGVLGVIPGSMATPGFVVRGLGGAGSLRSASHGAGRVMSRTKARESFAW